MMREILEAQFRYAIYHALYDSLPEVYRFDDGKRIPSTPIPGGIEMHILTNNIKIEIMSFLGRYASG